MTNQFCWNLFFYIAKRFIIDRVKVECCPGGETWTDIVHQPILRIAERCLKEGILVAAICGATMGLAQTGLLNSRWHTSNDLEYLKMICPTYTGENYYKMESAVTDGNLEIGRAHV